MTSLYTSGGFQSSVNSNAWQNLLAARKQKVEALGAKFLQLIVPEKMSIYPLPTADIQTVFPDCDPANVISPGRRLVSSINGQGVIFPDEFLRRQTKDFEIFPKTDSHWSWKGAFSAFQILMSALKYAPNFDTFVNLPRHTLVYHGDLWDESLTNVPKENFERISFPQSIARIYANSLMGFKEHYGVEDEAGLHVGSSCIFLNLCSPMQESVTIFGSSFSEARLAPSLLTAIFSYYFREVHFVWSASLDFGYIERNRTSLVIAEIPERFVTEVPNDLFDVEQTAVRKIQAWKAAQKK